MPNGVSQGHNGVEFLDHATIKSILGVEVYYTHAYAAYEKGAIENINRLIRHWYPKGTDFSRVESCTM